MFSARLPLTSLIELCRVLRHYLSSGLGLVDVFRQQAQRGSPRVRALCRRVCTSLEEGHDLEKALKPEKAAFPPLFVALAGIGEESGNLPEVFAELEKYFLMQQKLRRQFLSAIAWPVLQLNMAIFVVTGLIWILGLIASMYGAGTKPLDPLGLGLVGDSGALIFFFGAYGSLAALIGLYLLARRTLQGQALIDGLLLRVPVVGPCQRALALTRFCLALRLTTETGMSIASAVRLSLRATSNAAFVARTDAVVARLKGGDDLTMALSEARLFPEEFLHIVAVAEESGRLTEVMQHQTEHYEQEASRRLTVLNMMAMFGVWLAVAILLIVMIFRIFTIAYLGPINDLLQ
jgi:type IV pilus assembly protein PilC